VTPTPNLSGTGGYIIGGNGTDTDFVIDALLDGAGNTVARAWEEVAATYTAQIKTTWVNFQTAQPAGFAGNGTTTVTNAQNVATGSRIVNSTVS
jgi:hypothetical protein